VREEETVPTFPRTLEQVLHGARLLADERHQEYATLQHLLPAIVALHSTIEFFAAPRCWRWSGRSCRKKSKTDQGVAGQRLAHLAVWRTPGFRKKNPSKELWR